MELKDIKENDLAMSNKNFALTYYELLLLLKDAYRNGYATYEMTAAGLERYDDDGYARWVLLGMNKEQDKAVNYNHNCQDFRNNVFTVTEHYTMEKCSVCDRIVWFRWKSFWKRLTSLLFSHN